jgi:ligand-binding SRPBCC domain-containing protein
MFVGTYSLERRQLIPRPRREVFGFFAEAANLERLTPGFLHFRILTPQPIRLRPGTLIDYRLRLYGVPLRWQTRIERFEPPQRFTDTQIAGPYRRWHHRHEFVEVPGGTLVIDRVHYELPFGPLGILVHRLVVRGMLERIFAYRQERLAELFQAPDATQRTANRFVHDPDQAT